MGASADAGEFERPAGLPRPQSFMSKLRSLDEDQPASQETLQADLDLNDRDSPTAQRMVSEAAAPVSLTGDSSSWAPGQIHVSSAAYIAPSTFLFIFVWYVTGALTNSTSKQALSVAVAEGHVASPPFMSLTLMQHIAASFWGNVSLRVLCLRRWKPLPESAKNVGFLRMVLVYSIGFCMTNGSFGKVNASFVDTVKAGEPIATMILTVLFLSAESVTLPVCLSLLPIVAGVGISSMAEASFNALGFGMAMSSNLCFAARSICAKLLRSELGKTMDNASLFCHVNMYGAMLLLPLVLFFEGNSLLIILQARGPATKLFLLNGCLYYLNNQMNFLVLEKVDAVTHGLINCGRRIANIAFAILWFGIPVSRYNGAGISLAILGAFCYMKAKQMSVAAPQPRKPAPTSPRVVRRFAKAY